MRCHRAALLITPAGGVEQPKLKVVRAVGGRTVLSEQTLVGKGGHLGAGGRDKNGQDGEKNRDNENQWFGFQVNAGRSFDASSRTPSKSPNLPFHGQRNRNLATRDFIEALRRGQKKFLKQALRFRTNEEMQSGHPGLRVRRIKPNLGDGGLRTPENSPAFNWRNGLAWLAISQNALRISLCCRCVATRGTRWLARRAVAHEERKSRLVECF